jgi:hypothetical protein
MSNESLAILLVAGLTAVAVLLVEVAVGRTLRDRAEERDAVDQAVVHRLDELVVTQD